jgi:hypothetical protein
VNVGPLTRPAHAAGDAAIKAGWSFKEIDSRPFANDHGHGVPLLAPPIIGVFAASLGFGGVFGLTTAVLSVGVVCVVVFGLSTAGRSLEELTERSPTTTTAEGMTK